MRLPKADPKDIIPAKAGTQVETTGFSRIKFGAGSIKPGMTNCVRLLLGHDNGQGFTLIEIMVSLLTLSIVMVGFWMVMPAEKDDIDKTKERRIALFLTKQMMEEIQSKAYEDPDLSSNSFGPEEPAPRENFDDIDDYDDWDENPPQYPDGTILNGENEIPNYQDLRRQVTVENVDNSDYGTVKPDGTTNSKRITVKVLSTKNPKSFEDDEIIIRWVATREGMELLY